MSDEFQPQHKAPPPPEKWPAPGKQVVFQLSWIPSLQKYQIVSVSDTSRYKPHQWFDEAGVHALELIPGVHFTATSPDYLAMVLGLAGKMVALPTVALGAGL